MTVTERFQARLEVLSEAAARAVVARLRAVDPQDLGPSMRAFVEDAAAIVESGQAAAIALAGGYFRAHSREQFGEALDLDETADAGMTADGRTIEQALAATPAKFFLALQLGRGLAEAMSFAEFSAARLARTEVVDAGSRALTGAADAIGVGWRWVASGTCGACLAMDDGSVRTGPLNRHPGCRCVAAPSLGTAEDRPTGRERFDAMTDTEQDALLGPEKAGLLRSGEISWEDLVHVERFRRWTPAVVEATLDQATG